MGPMMSTVDRATLLKYLEAPLGLAFPNRKPDESLTLLLQEAGLAGRTSFEPDALARLGELLSTWGEREVERSLQQFEQVADSDRK
jgi:hypothetical protein